MRLSTVQIGASAEDWAVRALEERGYRIVDRNFRCYAGELDIVARQGGTLIFVEVRSRRTARHGHAAEMVNAGKRIAVTRVAQAYIALRRPAFSRVRFDVVAVTGTEIDVVRDAWRL